MSQPRAKPAAPAPAKKNGGKNPIRTLVVWGLVVLAGVILVGWIFNRRKKKKASPQASAQAYNTPMSVYSNYQSEDPVLPAAALEQAYPEGNGYTYKSAIPPAPLCVVCNKKVCECWRRQADARFCGGAPKVTGCMDWQAANFDPAANIPCTNCCVPKIYGCLDRNATNFDPRANTPWQFCTYSKDMPGCTQPWSLNYDKNAVANDGSCVPKIVGCMNPAAQNYQPDANTPCYECCAPTVPGCQNKLAPNWNPDANVPDGSCITPDKGCTDPLAQNFSAAAIIPTDTCVDVKAVAPSNLCGNFATGGRCAPSGTTPMATLHRMCSTWDIKSHDLGSSATAW